jgi:hypothetical protein
MWSHPSFFSMGWWHWGQGLVHRAKKSAMAVFAEAVCASYWSHVKPLCQGTSCVKQDLR